MKMIKHTVKSALKFSANISPEFSAKAHYYIKFKKKLNLRNPTNFNEKIQWLKFNEYKGDIYTLCADKYKVREYIISKGCGEILNELYGVYDNPQAIDYDALPEKFALKCNHGAGYNIICDNKSSLDIEKTNKKLNEWLKQDFSSHFVEPQYKKIERKILCEKFIENESGGFPDDYKFYCFNGKPYAVMVCIGREKGTPKFYYFDMDWNPLPFEDTIELINDNQLPEMPEGFHKMKEYAFKLATDFKFVRADFYLLNGEVIFGELTFTPSAGLDVTLQEADVILGGQLKL
ncbi:ATP-grasp fold amidoligase family protein [Pantoea sp. EA-12]|uniref:ATP-grasp fold amidoligase family protein n=1 Tax=Pantoea sp. EA-12 TaxID=3043303 RepID=UPI0024B4A6CD|nr:ATP-grasp fold amidoligase family protein [Pantoea sp. EA-12]MDI9219750.1 ATP-grasp fold amidoligase family protein [Pantoea sp. EA-12]